MVDSARKTRRRSRSELSKDTDEAIPKATEEATQKEETKKRSTAKKESTSKQATTKKIITSKVDSSSSSNSNNNTSETSKNELSKLIPGYTAPLQLTSALLDKFRPAGGLEALRRQAVRTDRSTAPVVAGTAANKKLTGAMLQKSSRGGLPSTYAAAYASFKKGAKPVIKNDAGSQWFGMAPTPMSKELTRDLALIRNRNYLDPKRFYKSTDKTAAVVQLGTVIEGASEFYSARLTKKQRRSNLTEEIMADPDTASYAQDKYRKMQRAKTAEKLKWKKGGRKGKK